jgi:hypothetical protein
VPHASPPPEPGDRPPPGLLARAPGARYASTARVEGGSASRASATRPALVGVVVAAIGAAILVVLTGPLSVTTGLLLVAAAVGWAIGLAVKLGGGAALGGGRSAAIAVVLALGACVVGWVGAWAWSRATGGALGPVDFLGEVYGILVPAQAAFAVTGAVFGSR